MNEVINCKVCGKKLKGKQTLFCSIHCKNTDHQGYSSQKIRGVERKLLLVKNRGGKCSICGYRKNLAALTFHHINPKEKEFKLDMRSLSNRKLSRINNEFKKCILVCHNCHAELHNPQHNVGRNP